MSDVVLALAFVIAGLSKSGSPLHLPRGERPRRRVHAWRMLGLTEISAAGLVLIRPRLGAGLIVAALLVFTTYLLTRERSYRCDCFSTASLESPLTTRNGAIVRNVYLIALGIGIAVFEFGTIRKPTPLGLFLPTALLVMLYSIATFLSAGGQTRPFYQESN